MKNISLIISLVLVSFTACAQTIISGKVLDEKGKPVPGVNVFIKGSYDGATADAEGGFKFSSDLQNQQLLAATCVGFEAYSKTITLKNEAIIINIKLKETANELNTVTITAGTFEASDERKTTIIKPLDIVTTAGGGADLTQTLTLLTPGAQRNGESTGMFVRGGSAQESKIMIDGLTVQNAFNTPSPDVASRSRFSPFQFKGSAFSTGAYSAQYGQALSAVLQLNTMDLATESGYTLNANLAQLSAGYTHLNNKKSINGTVAYNNLTPLFSIYPQNVDWVKIPQQINISTSYRLKQSAAENFKLDAVYGKSISAIKFKNDDEGGTMSIFDNKNDNLLLTSTHQKSYGKDAQWQLKSGASYSYNFDDLQIDQIIFGIKEEKFQLRSTATRFFTNNNNILFGTEIHKTVYNFKVNSQVKSNNYKLIDNYVSLFSESEFYITRKLAGRVGVRSEYSSLANGFNIAPRVSFAYKTGSYSQVSVAGGQFYQTPFYQYYFLNKGLTYEKATHGVLNYQIIKNKRIFRVEGYLKDYQSLVREYATRQNFFDANPRRFPDGRTDNSGNGHAQGVDVFFRDSKTIAKGDFWLNYSYCDSKRLFANYLQSAQPTFVSKHNLNVVYKHFIPKPMMTVSATYSYTSGRPYFNPNEKNFLSNLSPSVHNTSVWVNYLTNIKGHFTVVYFSVDNVLGTKNIYTYRYSEDGKTRNAITPTAYRTIMIGTYIIISKKKVIPDEMKKN